MRGWGGSDKPHLAPRVPPIDARPDVQVRAAVGASGHAALVVVERHYQHGRTLLPSLPLLPLLPLLPNLYSYPYHCIPGIPGILTPFPPFPFPRGGGLDSDDGHFGVRIGQSERFWPLPRASAIL